MSASPGESCLPALLLGLTLATGAAGAAGPAPDPSGPPDPEEWAARLHTAIAAHPEDFAGGRFVGRVALAFGGKGGFRPLLSLSPVAWEKVSQTDLASMGSIAFSAKLNAYDAHTLDASALMALGDADAAVAVSDEGSAEVFEPRTGVAIASAVLGSAPGSGPPPAVALARVLVDALGYDGVVLEDAGALILARTPALAGRGDLFAVALEGSEGKARLAANERQRGKAMMQLVRSHGHFAVFRKLAALTLDRLPFGTKLIIERPTKGRPATINSSTFSSSPVSSSTVNSSAAAAPAGEPPK